MASQSRRLTITYIPGFQITSPDLPIPRTNSPLQDLTNQLIEQGGGTLIIEEQSSTNQAETTATTHISQQDTTTIQKTNQEQTTSNPPRASPILDKIFYIFLAGAFIIILLKARTRQCHTVQIINQKHEYYEINKLCNPAHKEFRAATPQLIPLPRR
jgi:hypothetical protein